MTHEFYATRAVVSLTAGWMLAMTGCAVGERPTDSVPASRVPAAPRAFDFIARVDPSAGTLEISSLDSHGRALAAVPVVKDMVAGSGPGDTVELVSANIRHNCISPTSFCADVTLRSFFGVPVYDAVVEITSITDAVGHTGLNSDPSFMGLSNTYGLWVYGNLAASGGSAMETWEFGNNGAGFQIVGRVLVDMAPVAGIWDQTLWDNATWQ